MRYKKNGRHILILVAFIFCVVSLFGSVNAMQFNPSRDTTIDCDITVNYGAGWRVSDRDKYLVYDPNDPGTNPSKINLDDGDSNFDQWDWITNKLTILADIDISHKNVGVFIRPKVFYDHVYMSDNSNDTDGSTNNAFLNPNEDEDIDEWHEQIERIHGTNATILDLYAYANFELADRLAEIRVGRQVVSWGTSLLVSGGISSAQSHIDVAAAAAVGTEVKEIYLPSEQLYFAIDLTDDVTLSTYYQWKYNKSVLYEGGTFYATTDFVDNIRAPVLAAPNYPYYFWAGEDNPRRGGQYGVAITYKPAWGFLNQTEFGFYYINYHDKLPQFIADAANNAYYIDYTEDIQLYGFSFDTAIGDANVAGEFSYRDDYVFSWISPTEKIEGNYYQAQLSTIYAVAFQPIADRISTIGEVACFKVIGVADKYKGVDVNVDDPFCWRYVLRAGLDWYQVLTNLDVTMTLAYTQTMSGTSIKNLGLYEGAEAGSIGFSFLYKNVYKASLTYEDRMNSHSTYSTSDRDTIKLALSYTF